MKKKIWMKQLKESEGTEQGENTEQKSSVIPAWNEEKTQRISLNITIGEKNALFKRITHGK